MKLINSSLLIRILYTMWEYAIFYDSKSVNRKSFAGSHNVQTVQIWLSPLLENASNSYKLRV